MLKKPCTGCDRRRKAMLRTIEWARARMQKRKSQETPKNG